MCASSCIIFYVIVVVVFTWQDFFCGKFVHVHWNWFVQQPKTARIPSWRYPAQNQKNLQTQAPKWLETFFLFQNTKHVHTNTQMSSCHFCFLEWTHDADAMRGRQCPAALTDDTIISSCHAQRITHQNFCHSGVCDTRHLLYTIMTRASLWKVLGAMTLQVASEKEILQMLRATN